MRNEAQEDFGGMDVEMLELGIYNPKNFSSVKHEQQQQAVTSSCVS